MTISTRFSPRPEFRSLPKTQSPGDTETSRVGQSPAPTSSTATDPGATSRTAPTGHSAHSHFEPAPADAPVSLTPGAKEISEPDWSRRMRGLPPNAIRADEAQRTPAIARAQEQLISGAGSEPVQFTNANGQTEALQFTREGDNAWRVTDAHDNSMLIEGQPGLTQEELLRGTAAFADYWSQYPEHLRSSMPHINLFPGSMTGRYNNVTRELSMGVEDDLDEMTFDHEFGHTVGFEFDQQYGMPPNWETAMQADGVGRFPSQYAADRTQIDGDPHEDFAEAWLAYVEARERPDSARQLERLQREFPNRFAIIEQVYNGTLQP